MIKNTRKGFTTVELVIVIAVIAILATALIPTFGGLIENANETSRDQAAKNLYNDFLIENPTGHSECSYYIVVDGYYYEVTNGGLELEGTKPTTAPECTADGFAFAIERTDAGIVVKAGTKPCTKDCDICVPAQG